jgi:hypothetical protein
MERHHKGYESTSPVNTDQNHTNFKTQDDLQLSGIGPYDVLCGRHKLAFNNIGNRRFRITVSLSLERYLTSPRRQDKTLVVFSIVKLIKENGGRFLKWKKDRWIDLEEKQAREKVGHALRDMASARDFPPSLSYASSSAKKGNLLQSSNRSTSEQKQCIPLQAGAFTLCHSDKSESITFNKNDSAVESIAPFECEIFFPVPLESYFKRDISDDNLFKSLFENELESLDEAIFGSPAAPTA